MSRDREGLFHRVDCRARRNIEGLRASLPRYVSNVFRSCTLGPSNFPLCRFPMFDDASPFSHSYAAGPAGGAALARADAVGLLIAWRADLRAGALPAAARRRQRRRAARFVRARRCRARRLQRELAETTKKLDSALTERKTWRRSRHQQRDCEEPARRRRRAGRLAAALSAQRAGRDPCRTVRVDGGALAYDACCRASARRQTLGG